MKDTPLTKAEKAEEAAEKAQEKADKAAAKVLASCPACGFELHAKTVTHCDHCGHDHEVAKGDRCLNENCTGVLA